MAAAVARTVCMPRSIAGLPLLTSCAVGAIEGSFATRLRKALADPKDASFRMTGKLGCATSSGNDLYTYEADNRIRRMSRAGRFTMLAHQSDPMRYARLVGFRGHTCPFLFAPGMRLRTCAGATASSDITSSDERTTAGRPFLFLPSVRRKTMSHRRWIIRILQRCCGGQSHEGGVEGFLPRFEALFR